LKRGLIKLIVGKSAQKPMLMSSLFMFTSAYAQINPRLDDVIKGIDIPHEYQSLIESVELRASSVVGNMQSAFSSAASAATAIPTDLLSEVAGILPTETPAQTHSGAILRHTIISWPHTGNS
jgi:malate/lactate dehydrogenase